MTKKALTLATTLLAAIAITPTASAVDDFFQIEAHALTGRTGITQNYLGCYPEISELDTSMGTGWGFGFDAQASLHGPLSLGIQLNFIVSNRRINMLTTDDDATSMSYEIIRNRYYTFNFPIYLSYRLFTGESVSWNADAGLYYSYGLGGDSKSTIYNVRINEVGQLIKTNIREDVNYYNDNRTHLNSSERGDIGLHLATSLTFRRKFVVRGTYQIGFRNIAKVYNAVATPNIHNQCFLFSVGYIF